MGRIVTKAEHQAKHSFEVGDEVRIMSASYRSYVLARGVIQSIRPTSHNRVILTVGDFSDVHANYGHRLGDLSTFRAQAYLSDSWGFATDTRANGWTLHLDWERTKDEVTS